MIKEYFSQRTRREQNLIVSLIVIMAFIFIISAFSYLESTKTNVNEDYISFKNQHKQLSSVLLLNSTKTKLINKDINLISAVSGIAKNKNISIDRIQPSDSNEIIVSINNAEFSAVHEFLKELEEKMNIQVIKATIRKNSQSEASGVRSQLVLKSKEL
jgi:type II secretory pathway component PulM